MNQQEIRTAAARVGAALGPLCAATAEVARREIKAAVDATRRRDIEAMCTRCEKGHPVNAYQEPSGYFIWTHRSQSEACKAARLHELTRREALAEKQSDSDTRMDEAGELAAFIGRCLTCGQDNPSSGGCWHCRQAKWVLTTVIPLTTSVPSFPLPPPTAIIPDGSVV